MQQADEAAFKQLFRDACRRCFGHDLSAPLSETESKLFYTKVLEDTGLVIGWKSVKNYSLYVQLEPLEEERRANPTVMTLDTLARFVLGAPYTDEATRKAKEGHCPYWFQYKEEFHRRQDTGRGLPAKRPDVGPPARRDPWRVAPIGQRGVEARPVPKGLARRFFFYTFRGAEQVLAWGRLLVPEPIRHSWLARWALVLTLGGLTVWGVREHYARKVSTFIDTFSLVEGDSIEHRGWALHFPDSAWWAQRGDKKGALTLFTLQGDNWPDSAYPPHIRNLLLRPLTGSCFTAEVHFEDFMPTENWQQAGLLLMEDTGLASRSLRLTIAYNDYSGGFAQPRQIIVQGVSSGGNPSGKPEEILHRTLFLLGAGRDRDSLVRENLRHSALRIEKRGNTYRFLYSGGQGDNFAFLEVGTQSLYITPRYIGLFALKGYRDTTKTLPVAVHYFSLQEGGCEP